MLESGSMQGRLPSLIVAIALTVGMTGNLPGQSAPVADSPPDTKIPAEEKESVEEAVVEFDLPANLESFDEVWSTIDKVHWDEDRVGQTWDEARAKHRPQVEAAESIEEVRDILNAMIEELGQSHFGIIAASAYDVVGDENKSGDGDTGLSFRSSEDGIVVSSVRVDSPADQAGVQPGWVLESIGEKEASELVKKMQAAAKGPMRFETIVGLAIPKIASGTVGDSKQIVLRDGEGKTQELDLELEPKPGKKTTFGHLPPIYVDSKTKTLPGKVGYYYFSAFLDPIRIMKEFREAVDNDEHSGGIIIDLRGNIGGLGAMTMGMASEFSDKESALGVMTTKGTKLKFFVTKNYDPVTCPVAILIDECSISSAEIFSGGLQDLKLARLFGTRTAGLALPSTVVKLPNGDGFQYAIADYHSASGKTLEKDGVTPDEEILLTRELLLNDPDPVMSRAQEWIKQQQSDK
jgi:carboxyl-terminal processing protease